MVRADAEAADADRQRLAFVVLAGLSALAYPALRLRWKLLALAAFGAFIELMQAIPALHRDADVMDWLADIAALAVAAVMIAGVRHVMRRRGR